jgi:hypothetical protein
MLEYTNTSTQQELQNQRGSYFNKMWTNYVENIDPRRQYVMGSKIPYNSDHNEEEKKKSKLRPVKVISLVYGV